jgi:hypothetical protein
MLPRTPLLLSGAGNRTFRVRYPLHHPWSAISSARLVREYTSKLRHLRPTLTNKTVPEALGQDGSFVRLQLSNGRL